MVQLFDEVDADHNGSISYKELTGAVEAHLSKIAVAWRRDGSVSIESNLSDYAQGSEVEVDYAVAGSPPIAEQSLAGASAGVGTEPAVAWRAAMDDVHQKRLDDLAAQVEQLEDAKAEAVEVEDYGRAKELKGEVDDLKALIEKEKEVSNLRPQDP